MLQFSWADPKEVRRINELAEAVNIRYSHIPISTHIPTSVASLYAIIGNRKKVLNSIKSDQINTVIPRSTMPAFLLLSIYKQVRELGCELIFDADGLPIQERLDQGGLKEGSIMHRILSGVERKMLINADKVITRTQRSIDWHLNNLPHLNGGKFFLVGNGRDSKTFYFDKAAREEVRKKLTLTDDELLIVHSGSLGPAYSIELLFNILKGFQSAGLSFRMIFLCRDSVYLNGKVPEELSHLVQLCKVPFLEIPSYLSAADLGISLRTTVPSVRGILPIKVGEYLMCGLPTLISSGIGDLDSILGQSDACFFLKHSNFSIEAILNWSLGVKYKDRIGIQNLGQELFSLETTLDSYEEAVK